MLYQNFNKTRDNGCNPKVNKKVLLFHGSLVLEVLIFVCMQLLGSVSRQFYPGLDQETLVPPRQWYVTMHDAKYRKIIQIMGQAKYIKKNMLVVSYSLEKYKYAQNNHTQTDIAY